MKDKLIDLITEPKLRGKIQDMLKKDFNIDFPNNMHIQADIEGIIIEEIEKNYNKLLRECKLERVILK